MIHYLVTRQHAYTMASFLESWGRALAGRIRIVPYEDVLGGTTLPTGKHAYIFSDLDRVGAASSAKDRGLLADLHAHLVRSCGMARILNDPSRSLLRFDLLRRLYQDGLNRFAVWRAAETPTRFPVFLRREAGFEQRTPTLIPGEEDYAAAVGDARDSGRSLHEVIAVEFCDTSQAGVYRKYGAFVVGGRVIPRHLFFDRQWMVKVAAQCGPQELQEEVEYVEGNPHAAELARIAARANISYGRIDYSLVDGCIQTWEINTNPLIANRGATMGDAERDAVHARFVGAFCAALEALDA